MSVDNLTSIIQLVTTISGDKKILYNIDEAELKEYFEKAGLKGYDDIEEALDVVMKQVHDLYVETNIDSFPR